MTGAESPVPAELSMVVLTSHDVPRLRRFYRALGWSEQAGATDQLCRYELGSVVLTLYPHDGPADGQERNGPSHVTLVVPLSARDLVDEATRTAIDAGAQPVSPPTDQSWGGRASVVADPDGHRWEFLWVPTHQPEA